MESKELLIPTYEHYTLAIDKDQVDEDLSSILFEGDKTKECVSISKADDDVRLSLSYYIGVDWLKSKSTAIYVQPKLNKEGILTDYISMLLTAFQHADVAIHTHQLFEIKFDKPLIKIEQKQDNLTPLLVIQFLSLVKKIVKKGLKKSYYKIEKNLVGRMKGKVLVSSTIKHNLTKSKMLSNYCQYDEFGINNIENRLLKRTLVFVQRYLPSIKGFNAQTQAYLKDILAFINPAFRSISEKVTLREIQSPKTNPFYKEYEKALELSKLILKRFGYNLNNIEDCRIVEVPPFWIDMSKLFELYVLGLLKNRFGEKISYHVTTESNELDYLLNADKLQMVIDAKYKPQYKSDYIDKYMTQDLRQVSGYARLKKVYKLLGLDEQEPKLIDCLVIYPDQENGCESLVKANLKKCEIDQYVGVYKIGVRLPLQV